MSDSVTQCLTIVNSSESGCSAESGEAGLWYVGVILSILSSIASNFGVNTQKYSMIKEIRRGTNRAYSRQPIWMLGLLMVVGGALSDFAALGFAAASLITPVGGMTMVANLFFASYWLGETITRLDLVSTGLIVLGVILVAAFADKSSQCFTLPSLLCLYTRVEFIIYAVCMVILMSCFYASIIVVRKRVKQMKADDETDSPRFARYKTYYPLLCASLSGLVGSQSVLFAKSTIEIVKSTMRGGSEFVYFGTYVIILFMVVSIFGQIHWLAVGLKEFDAVIMVPVFQCVFVVFTIIGGGAYFGEFENFNKLQIIMFPVGVLVLIIGVLGLAMHKSRSAEELLLDSDGVGPEELEDPSDLEAGSEETGNKVSSASSAAPVSVVSTASTESARRRRSMMLIDEYKRQTPSGALRFTPAVMLWGDLTDEYGVPDSPLFGSDNKRHSKSDKFRRQSTPGFQQASRRDLSGVETELHLESAATASLASSHATVEVDLDENTPRSARSSKALSFAGVEHLLTGSLRGSKKSLVGKFGLDNPVPISERPRSEEQLSDLAISSPDSSPEGAARSGKDLEKYL